MFGEINMVEGYIEEEQMAEGHLIDGQMRMGTWHLYVDEGLGQHSAMQRWIACTVLIPPSPGLQTDLLYNTNSEKAQNCIFCLVLAHYKEYICTILLF